MTSILFELGRDLVNEVQAGVKAHQDVREGKEVERRQDKWGDPLPPKTIYSMVRGVEETLGMGKGNGQGKGKGVDTGTATSGDPESMPRRSSSDLAPGPVRDVSETTRCPSLSSYIG